ncbi:hypothetical protein FPV67DRAFT_1469704 [Lyophyllum atratum]|nr:hypothetical protein FPV67DRAFT_1469704 [Lyophyllum atratum]
MEHNLYTQWVQQPLLSDPTHSHDSRPSSLDDWSKDRSVSSSQPATADTSGTGMDMGDFGSLADIGAPSTSPSSLASPTSSFFTPYQHSYFVPSPYNTLAYGSTWPPSSHVPLSNYSSLNGATTSATPSSSSSSSQQQQSQQQQQHSPPHQHQQVQQQSSKHQSQVQSQSLQMHSPGQPMVIDPALTTLNGSRTTNMQHYPQANYSAQSTQHQQPQSLSQQQFSYSQLLHPSLYRPAGSYYQTPQQQQQQQQGQQHSPQQGTLSPQALHAPSSSMLSSLLPSSFYNQSLSQPQPQPLPPAPQKPLLTPQERNAQFQSSIRPLLQNSAFTGAQAVSILVDRILDFGTADVEPTTRLEIFTKMRDGAGNHYFRAWSENPTAIDVTRDWLKAGFTANDDSPLVETIMPLLHIIDRLPMTVDSLKASKLGKIVVKLVKDPPSPAIKDMASNLERKWRSMVSSAAEAPSSKAAEASGAEDIKSKKRKLAEPTLSRGPTKKAALGSTTSSKPTTVKKEPSSKPASSGPAVKDAKSDSSFFSAPKPKPKLPSFKKAPPPPAPAAPAKNVAQPSSINPFEEVLKSMGRGRKDSPAVSTPPSSGTPPQNAQQYQHPQLTKKGTKKKSVTWAPPAQLEAIRFIEKAIYDDDPVDGIHMSHSLRDLDRGEGAALHAHLFEETVDWSEPLLVEIPIDIELRQRGEGSEEKTTQETREQTALGALYMSPAHIPDSPAEPSHVIAEDEVDRNVQAMTSGPDVDAVFWSSGPVSPVAHSVAELVGQLAGGNMNVDPALSGAQFNGQGLDLAAVGLDAGSTLAAVQALPQEHIQRLLQQLQTSATQQPPNMSQPGLFPQSGQPPTPYNAPDQNHNAWGGAPNYSAEYGQGFQNHEEDRNWGANGRGRGRGRGGRGRGRGEYGYRDNTRRPCTFFAAGRCKYGDQCDFSHENPFP